MITRLKLRLAILLIDLLWPLFIRGVPGTKAGLIAAVRWRVWLAACLHVEVDIHRVGTTHLRKES